MGSFFILLARAPCPYILKGSYHFWRIYLAHKGFNTGALKGSFSSSRLMGTLSTHAPAPTYLVVATLLAIGDLSQLA
jgi:hypothetical protein